MNREVISLPARARLVSSFEELLSTPFADGVNALCWCRELAGDFADIVDKLACGKGITPIDDERLMELSLTEAGDVARQIILQDLELLRSRDLLPSLDCVNGYNNAVQIGSVRTDVQSWHADSATAEADTYLCTYHGACSEGLINEEAICRANIPETRAELLKLHGGADDESFAEYLNDHFYDLHYAPLPNAKPYAFGLHNLWRVATDYPGSPVPPCIHRAPDTVPGQTRLLLIS